MLRVSGLTRIIYFLTQSSIHSFIHSASKWDIQSGGPTGRWGTKPQVCPWRERSDTLRTPQYVSVDFKRHLITSHDISWWTWFGDLTDWGTDSSVPPQPCLWFCVIWYWKGVNLCLWNLHMTLCQDKGLGYCTTKQTLTFSIQTKIGIKKHSDLRFLFKVKWTL